MERASPPPMRFGYVRVSTADQKESLQLDALRSAGCDRVFTDHVSGTVEDRPGLDGLLDQLRPGDAVVVWRLDRLGRSLRHLIELAGELERRQVALVSLTESLDTSTPGGKLVFHVFGALAEFERDLVRERTMAGLAAARARGRQGGRPRALTPEKVKTARALHSSGEHDVSAIARILGVSRATVYRALADNKATTTE